MRCCTLSDDQQQMMPLLLHVAEIFPTVTVYPHPLLQHCNQHWGQFQANVIHHLVVRDPDGIPHGEDGVERTLFLRKITEEALRVTRCGCRHRGYSNRGDNGHVGGGVDTVGAALEVGKNKWVQ